MPHVVGVPTDLLLGADGIERRRFVGFVPASEMRAALAELRSRPAAGGPGRG